MPCDAEPMPAALSAWGMGISVTTTAGTASALAVGTTAAPILHPPDHVRPIAAPRRASESVSHSGYVAVDVA